MSLPSVFDYLPRRAPELMKLASSGAPGAAVSPGDELPPRPLLHALGTVASGLGGLGAGTLAGYGAGALADGLTRGRIPKGALQAAGPLVGGAAGLAYSLYKQKELEELERAVESYRDQSRRRRSRE